MIVWIAKLHFRTKPISQKPLAITIEIYSQYDSAYMKELVLGRWVQ